MFAVGGNDDPVCVCVVDGRCLLDGIHEKCRCSSDGMIDDDDASGGMAGRKEEKKTKVKERSE